MVDRHRVDQLLAQLAEYIQILRALADTPLDDFRADPRNYGSAERFLQIAIETTLNVGHHLVAARGLPQPSTYADVFRTLGRHQVVDAQFAARLEPMARMRNRLVHMYDDVDPGAVHQILRGRLDDFDEFARQIVSYLDGRDEADADEDGAARDNESPDGT